MSMRRIRDCYRVPAKRGMWIRFRGEPARITGTTRTHLYLTIRFGDGRRATIHPTWRVDYPTG